MTSVIVPVYPVNPQVAQYFQTCIKRLKEHTQSCELIVVQNGGEPLSVEADQLMYRSQPMGFARALNWGLASARGEYLALVSADVYVGAGWCDTLRTGLAAKGPGIICPTDQPVWGGVSEFSGWGACWLTTREVFTRVGYHDEMLNHRFSDQDYWIRVARAGYRVLCHYGVHVEHFEGSTVQHMPEKALWPAEEAYMKEKNGCSLYVQWAGRR